MKTKILLIALVFAFAIRTNAQITLDHFYTSDAPNHAFKLSLSGLKYFNEHYSNTGINSITYFVLYNPDHTIFKTINVPQIAGKRARDISYVSETLFDLDTLVEYMLYYQDSGSATTAVRVVNENGVVLLNVDSANFTASGSNDPFKGYIEKPIFPDGNQTKLYLYVNGGTKVFNLPGQLPCLQCDNGVVSGTPVIQGNTNASTFAKAFPNPSGEHFTIKYSLPKKSANNFLEIYDLQGMLVKKSKLNNSATEILVYNDELSSGTYLYRIIANDKVITSDKIIVSK